MADPADNERLEALEKRIDQAKSAHMPTRPHQDEHYSQAQVAWRMVTELVAGLAIGFGIGYGLDALFGTRPLLMVLFTLLGFAAGVKTMLRSAAQLQAKALEKPDADEGD